MGASPKIAHGERIYAIGDIHGRLDLFCDLVQLIRADVERRPRKRTRLLLIGDVIDRGPGSRALVERLIGMAGDPNLIVLRGNHEQMMLRALAGDRRTLDQWLRYGGDATLRSWNVPEDLLAGNIAILAGALGSFVPPGVSAWLRARPLAYRSGDFFFAHAGIKPGVPLDLQTADSLLWIEAEFLDCRASHPAVIVHGHSIAEDGPDLRPNRIALDTGAYRTGRLSAVGFEGTRQWTLSTAPPTPVAVAA